MRIVWDQNESRFLVELTPGELWREDMEAVKAAGFRTTGPPDWKWYATKATSLNKLRDKRPSSGLTLTEVALQKYQILNHVEQQKLDLRKKFKEAQKQAKKQEKIEEVKTYFDDELQITCTLVEPSKTIFVSKHVAPVAPTNLCIVCGEPVYYIDYPDICLWCDKIQKNSC